MICGLQSYDYEEYYLLGYIPDGGNDQGGN
jgi:hypothetical protein